MPQQPITQEEKQLLMQRFLDGPFKEKYDAEVEWLKKVHNIPDQDEHVKQQQDAVRHTVGNALGTLNVLRMNPHMCSHVIARLDDAVLQSERSALDPEFDHTAKLKELSTMFADFARNNPDIFGSQGQGTGRK